MRVRVWGGATSKHGRTMVRGRRVTVGVRGVVATAALALLGALAALLTGSVPASGQTGGSGASGATTTTTAPATTTTLAPGAKKKLLVVGDSVMKGVQAFGGLPVLTAAVPAYNVTFDAEESRSTIAGLSVILSHTPAQFDTIVIGLGANDAGSPDIFRARAQRVLDALKGNAHVYWLNVHEAGRFAASYKASNAALAQLAQGYPNTQIIDWNAVANGLPPGQISADGLHLSNSSAVAMANLIAASVNGTSPYSHSFATTTTAPTIPTSSSAALPPTTKASSGSRSSSNGVVIAIVVGAALLVVFLISAWAGRRRAKARRRREERTAKFDALFGVDPAADEPGEAAPLTEPTESAEAPAPPEVEQRALAEPTEPADQADFTESVSELPPEV